MKAIAYFLVLLLRVFQFAQELLLEAQVLKEANRDEQHHHPVEDGVEHEEVLYLECVVLEVVEILVHDLQVLHVLLAQHFKVIPPGIILGLDSVKSASYALKSLPQSPSGPSPGFKR